MFDPITGLYPGYIGHPHPIKGQQTNNSFTQAVDAVAKSCYRALISTTSLLPLSKRGLVFNIIRAPIFIPLRFYQQRGQEGAFQKAKAQIAKDWHQGISRRSTLLTKNHQEQVAEAMQYASYIYPTHGQDTPFLREMEKSKDPQLPILLSYEHPDLIESRQNYLEKNNEQAQVIKEVEENLEKMGFKADYLGNYYHVKSGTTVNLVLNPNTKEIVFAFKGLGNEAQLGKSEKYPERSVSKAEQRWILFKSCYNAVADWLGIIPRASLQAIEIGKMVKKAAEGSSLTPVMVGHSHGGGLAQAAAASVGLKSYVFNSRPLGAATRRYIGQDKIAENSRQMVAFSVQGDWLTRNLVANAVASLFERVIGIALPRSIGTGYVIPKRKGDDLKWSHTKFYYQLSELLDSSEPKGPEENSNTN